MIEYQEQSQSTQNNNPHIADLVIEDMKARKNLGKERYGTALQAFNGRDALQDAYEEELDKIVYMKQWIEEKRQIKEDLSNFFENINNQSYVDKQFLLDWIEKLILKLSGKL